MAAVVVVVVDDILQILEERMKLGQRWGIEHELREIHAALSTIMGVLPETENKYGRSLKIQEWVSDLKHAVFSVEDLLEQLSVEEALGQRKRGVRRLFRVLQRLTFRQRMRDELKDAIKRVHDVYLPDRISFVSNIPDEMGEAHEEAAGTVPLIGIDYQKERLVELLLNQEMRGSLPVIKVHGMKGIGKTALVRELSNSDVSRGFDVIFWVNASLPFDKYRMARDIICSLQNWGGVTEEENVVKEQLLVRVGKVLDGRKKYLFILDNLSFADPDRQALLRFCSFLGGGATGSKILATTRYSTKICAQESVFFLEDLTLEHSRDLLLKAALKGGVETNIDPEELDSAEEVAANCMCNPLILRAVGHYFSLQHDATSWSCFRDGFNDSSISRLLYGGYPYDHVGPMVKRYNHLPPRMKRCFAFCSLFPRGHVIDSQTLTELWIALGFIKSSNEDYQIANHYFVRLLDEELFRVNKLDAFGKVRSVMMHPDAENFARSVAGWECVSIGWNYSSWLRVKEALHASILDIEAVMIWDPSCFHGLRTVLNFVNDPRKCEIIWEYMFPGLKNLWVLNLHHRNLETLPEGVWKFKLLRYLDLSDNRRIQTLPRAIVGLPFLQTLKLSGCSALNELPQDMRRMVSLRHLYIDGCRKLCFMPKGLGDLKFLRILTDFIFPPDDSRSVDFGNFADLCKLNELRGSLRITNLGFHESARERPQMQVGLLDQKRWLESLELIFMNGLTDVLLLDNLRPHPNLKGLRIQNYGGIFFSEWMTELPIYLPDLVEVSLIGCRNLKHNGLPQFGGLRHLKSLTIQGMPYLLRMELDPGTVSLDITSYVTPFGELSSLCIRDCPKFKHLPMIMCLTKLSLVNVSEQIFQHPFEVRFLETLCLENIELLNHLPEEWLRGLTFLVELHIGRCPKFNDLPAMMPSLRKMTLSNVSEELFSKPCHLPVLKTLRLENIELLHHLPGDWLKGLSNLEELHFGSCPSLVSLSQGMMHLENLVSLTIWNCKDLDLSKDEYGNIMMELHGLRSLKFLTIYKASKMEYLPEWLSRVYTLRFLCLRSCMELVALPEWISKLCSLELVHCPQLTSFPTKMYESTKHSPGELSIIGCPLLQAEGIDHSRRL